MKSTFSLFLIATAFAASSAQAGQESVGIGYCASANTVCETSGDRAKDGSMVVCLFGQAKAHAYVSITENGVEQRHDFNVEKVAHDSHLLGAGVDYSGQGMELHINTDSPSRPQGIYSQISIEDLGIRNTVLFCKFKN